MYIAKAHPCGGSALYSRGHVRVADGPGRTHTYVVSTHVVTHVVQLLPGCIVGTPLKVCVRSACKVVVRVV